MSFRNKKVYGQSKVEKCGVCTQNAYHKNSQGLPVCKEHKNKVLEEKKCVCGESLEIKNSKWGAFFLCRNCGPISKSKAESADTEGYNINKKYRPKQKEIKYEKDRVYTLSELKELWKDI
ncbi:hypothetical protein GOV08_03320 [Candidatus Woesearchaeota archaeon]|nr:hypothetical protein [Candidatus Woesearchaeota archaeon]